LHDVPENVQIRDGQDTSLPPAEEIAPATDAVYQDGSDLQEGPELHTQAQQIYRGEPDTLVPGAYPGEDQDQLAPSAKDLVRTEIRGDLNEATTGKSGANTDETIDPSQLEYEPGHPPEPPDLDHGPPKDKLEIEDDDTALGRMPKMREDLSGLKSNDDEGGSKN
jgi:hypothetical protein